MDIFKILSEAIGIFVNKYNNTHPNPIHHSGKLFCIELPKNKIEEFEELIRSQYQDSGQKGPFYIYPNGGPKTLMIFGTHFKILPGDRNLVYEPMSLYDDGGFKTHIFKRQGAIIDNSVKIFFDDQQ